MLQHVLIKNETLCWGSWNYNVLISGWTPVLFASTTLAFVPAAARSVRNPILFVPRCPGPMCGTFDTYHLETDDQD